LRRKRCPAPKRISDDREALAALTTAGREDFAATPGGLAGAETDLAGAFLAMRAECRLHGFMGKRGPKSPRRTGGVKREVFGEFGSPQAPSGYFLALVFECEQPAGK
jgi:hypothetical protein